jgi:hypothetical protein
MSETMTQTGLTWGSVVTIRPTQQPVILTIFRLVHHWVPPGGLGRRRSDQPEARAAGGRR